MIDHLWQSTLFVGLIAMVMPLFRRQSADLRFWLWFAASVKFLFPLSSLMWLGGLFPPLPEHAPLLAAKSLVVTPELIAPDVMWIPGAGLLWTLWGLGALLVSVRWLAGWWQLQSLLQGASDLTLKAPIPVKVAASRLEPGLVGIVRPVVMIPRGIAELLSRSEMNALLAHELAHLSRRDNLLAILQRLVETIFWFHPLVWWVGARLVAERENACDQAVIDSGIEPETYASGILKICRFHLQPSPAWTAGMASGNLNARVSAIMGNARRENANGPRLLLISSLGIATLLVPLLAGVPGSAPVTQLVRKVASSVLLAPDLVTSVEMTFAAPTKPQAQLPIIEIAEAPPTLTVIQAPAAKVIAAPVVVERVDMNLEKVNAVVPASRGDASIECRNPYLAAIRSSDRSGCGRAEPGAAPLTEAQARLYVERTGNYTRLRRMEQDKKGLWRGTAIKGGRYGTFNIEQTGRVNFLAQT